MKKALKENKYFILLIIFAVVAIIFSTGHYNNIILDVGREVYYPERILDGKVLYKDLFCIYGPFSYLFNAVLYKLLGVKLSTLYIAGSLSAIGIVSAIYLIARKILSGILSFAIGVFTITTGICAAHLFNFTFPYSWAMVYGTLAFLYSLLFLVKFKTIEQKSRHSEHSTAKELDYCETTGEESHCCLKNNHKYLYISALFGGIAFSNKYDFLAYAVVLFLVIFQTRDIKTILKSILAFISVPAILFGILFLQGLQISDLFNFGEFLKAMTQSETLKYFYSTQGLYFRKQALIFMPVFFAITAVILGGLISAQKFNSCFETILEKPWRKIISTIMFIIFGIGAFLVTNPAEFIYLPILLVILGFLKFKKLLQNQNVLILIASAIAVSLKTFWGLTYMNYGNYYISVMLIAFFAFLFLFLPKRYEKSAAAFLIITALCIGLNYQKTKPDYALETPRGKISTIPQTGKSTSELIKYINENTEKTDRIVIFPEGLLINFLTNRKSDDYYNSMLPLYAEVLGEKTFIEHFKQNPPEYFIFNGQNMKDYYFEYICRDYAKDFCGFVSENYTPTLRIRGGLDYLIYKRK